MLGSGSHTETAARGWEAAAFTRDSGHVLCGLQKAWESEAWAPQPDRQGSLEYVISSSYGLGQMNVVPQFPHRCNGSHSRDWCLVPAALSQCSIASLSPQHQAQGLEALFLL